MSVCLCVSVCLSVSLCVCVFMCVKVREMFMSLCCLLLFTFKITNHFRKDRGKFGFAESLPKERITALKTKEAPVEMTDVQETASEIISNAEPPLKTYPFAILKKSLISRSAIDIRNCTIAIRTIFILAFSIVVRHLIKVPTN